MVINNVCFHGCHKLGKPFCRDCRRFHPGAGYTNNKEKPATHKNDTENPNLPE